MSIRLLPALFRLTVFALLTGLVGGRTAEASGPRWVAGVSYFNPAAKGAPVVWAGGQVSYFLDQGALSSTVSNSQAASLVAGAAAVWSSVPTAAVNIAQGGSLGEDVSGSNVTANVPAGTGAILPSDAQPTATSRPVAVVFDTDGTVIDDIYGVGASDASHCTQTGVYISVDNLSTAGSIAHALIVVNGLCATSNDGNALLQYELVRAFGRVLGLDWSQVNEAMWPSHATPDGLAGWPVMHPSERLCTGSAAGCMPNGGTLRPDDIAGLNQLYPVTSANRSAWPGKTVTATATVTVQGTVAFRNGQGMQGVNVELTPINPQTGAPDPRYTVSAVTGAYFRKDAGNAVMGATDVHGNLYGRFGTDDAAREGSFVLSGVPLPPGVSSAVYQLTIEPVNPQYTGDQSVGPYAVQQVVPSGAMQSVQLGSLSAGATATQNFTLTDTADGTVTDDGSEAQPNKAGGNGEWLSKLVGYGHTGWFQFHVRANRYFTVQALSLDENGFGAETKSAVVIGIWNGADAVGSQPDLAMTTPFNGAQVGLATLSAQTVADGEIRVAYADARGDGRPDFTYRSRILYADSVFPARLTLNGGTISILGQGFRPGIAVFANGAAAAVTSVTPTEITAVAPPVNAPTGTVTLAVQDPETLALAQIQDGLSYDVQGSDGVRIVNAPSGTVSQGVPMPMTVQVVAGDGQTPAPNVQVSFAVTSGSAQVASAGSCANNVCTAMTNGNGMATVTVTSTGAQATQVTASLANGSYQFAEFDGGAPPQIAPTNTLYLAIGAQVGWMPTAIVLSNGQPLGGTAVRWSGSTGAQVSTATSNATSNAAGLVSTTITAGPLTSGAAAHVYACQSQSTACATFTISAVHTETATLLPVSGVGQTLQASGTAMPVTLQVIDGGGHPMAGATVNLYQQMTVWQPPCPTTGRCPAPQQIGSQTTTLVSDANGLVGFAPMSNGGQPVTINLQATTGQVGTLKFSIVQRP